MSSTSGTQSVVPPGIPFQHRPLWLACSKFVADVCAGRDESHGHGHMLKVALNTLEILAAGSYTDTDWCIAIACAWLHDVCDHKYDPDMVLDDQVRSFIDSLFGDSNLTTLIVGIMYHVSFSKEDRHYKKGGTSDTLDAMWTQELVYDGKAYVHIRNIVSDADKLEAIGRIGVIRCIQYSIEKNYPDYHTMDQDQKDDVIPKVIGLLVKHCDEKLYRLKSGFIRTQKGYDMAVPLHNEMVDAVLYVSNNNTLDL